MSNKSFFDCDYEFVRERWRYSPEGEYDFIETSNFIKECINDNEFDNFRCLDLGSGPGFWFNYITNLGCSYCTAVDFSKEMLTGNNSNEIVCADLNEGIPKLLLENKYDVILLIHCLEYITNIQSLLFDCKTILSNDGIIIVVTKNEYAYCWRLIKVVADFFKKNDLQINWRSKNDFETDYLYVERVRGINCRMITMLNNVNSKYTFRGDGGFVRNIICKISSRISIHSIYNPLAWHCGLLIKSRNNKL